MIKQIFKHSNYSIIKRASEDVEEEDSDKKSEGKSSHMKAAAMYIAMLKAMTIIHQHGHWTAKGKQFYGEHLLFERIYKSAQENLDSAVEKFIGLLGVNVLQFTQQTELLNKVLSEFDDENSVERSLKAEKEFIKFSKDIYKIFEENESLTLGLDDMIMSISSDREEACYLLQQSKSSANEE